MKEEKFEEEEWFDYIVELPRDKIALAYDGGVNIIDRAKM